MVKKCEQCLRVYEGRKNQKYCSLKCKNEVNNERYRIEHSKLLITCQKIKNNAKVLEKLFYLVESKPIHMKILMEEGLEPAFINYQRKDGRLEFENWLLEEAEKDHYKIIPPNKTNIL